MSYSFSIYDKTFLRRALTENLGDWTGADPISDAVKARAIDLAEASGLTLPEVPPDELESMARRGIGRNQWVLEDDTHIAVMEVYSGSIVFQMPYSSGRDASVEMCRQIANTLTDEFDELELWEP